MSSVLSSVALAKEEALAKGDALRTGILVSSLALAAMAEAEPLPPKLEDYTHVCKMCGDVTHYPKSYTKPRSMVERLRDGCAKLRSLGLDITLDESVLCRHCVSADKLKIPRFATVVRRADYSNRRIGDKVEYLYSRDGTSWSWWYVAPRGNRYWVNHRYIDDDGNILGNNVCIRLHPDLKDPADGHANKGDKMKILCKDGDWVGVEWRAPYPIPWPASCFGDVEYGEGEDASLSRIVNHFEWSIKGRRSQVNLNDMELLLAYMRGSKKVLRGCIMQPIDEYLPEINKLLGKEPTDSSTTERSNP